MDSTSLTKPVDLQGLSLALAKTKADYEAQINKLAVPPDWEMENYDSFAYILNKPAIRAGDGEGSIVEGKQDTNASIATILITGEAGATTYSYTTEDTTLPTTLTTNTSLYLAYGANSYRAVTIIDGENHTITFDKTFSNSALTDTTVTLYYRCHKAMGNSSHAEGYRTMAASSYSHAEGAGSMATYTGSHAEGMNTKALSTSAHSEGTGTLANALHAHAEGSSTIASGSTSHAEGNHTIASSEFQHVQGKYNIEDSTNTYAHIVGNGSSSARSNAHTLDWSGNAWYAGKVSAGTVANPANPSAANDLATKAYVDANAGGSSTLVDLTDTTITTPADGQILKYDGTNQSWINSDFPKDVFLITATATYNSAAPDLFDYSFDKTYNEITTAYNAGKICLVKYGSEYYYYEGETSSNILFLSFYKDPHYDIYYINTFVITSSNNVSRYNFKVPQELADLKNVYIQSPHSGQSLIYSSGGNWKNGYIELTQLSDTTISSPTDGQVLTYDSTTSKWINSNTLTETRVNELIAAALAQYGDGDTASYGYTDASEVNY